MLDFSGVADCTKLVHNSHLHKVTIVQVRRSLLLLWPYSLALGGLLTSQSIFSTETRFQISSLDLINYPLTLWYELLCHLEHLTRNNAVPQGDKFMMLCRIRTDDPFPNCSSRSQMACKHDREPEHCCT